MPEQCPRVVGLSAPSPGTVLFLRSRNASQMVVEFDADCAGQGVQASAPSLRQRRGVPVAAVLQDAFGQQRFAGRGAGHLRAFESLPMLSEAVEVVADRRELGVFPAHSGLAGPVHELVPPADDAPRRDADEGH